MLKTLRILLISLLLSYLHLAEAEAPIRIGWISKAQEVIISVSQKYDVEMTDTLAEKIAMADYITAIRYGLDPNLFLAIQTMESAFDVNARGLAGELGLNQVLEKTARMICEKNGLLYDLTSAMDIYWNNELTAMLLNELRNKYGQNTDRMLSAYNGGPRAARKHRHKDTWQETRKYVFTVMKYYRNYDRINHPVSLFD